jgi:two-component system chemotaxis response regulator CheY
MSTNILIVEDSLSMRRMVRTALEDGGYRVSESEDGQQALALLSRTAPSLVITDIHMPVMDGLSLIREVRSLPDFRFLPILVLTTEANEEMKERGRLAGATGWIVKPFHPEQLRQVVSRVLRMT